jgi:glycosyltransferase involved in cell wall biosynthesis
MRVLQIVPSFHPATIYGGPIRSVLALCNGLARAGAEVRVLTTDANGPDATLDVPTDREVTVGDGVQVRYHRRRWMTSAAPGLLAALPEALAWADVVHLHAVYSFPTPPSLALARLRDVPLFWSPRGALQRWRGTTRPVLKALWDAGCRRIAAPGATLVVTSEAEAEASAERLPGIPVRVLPNGVDLPELDPTPTERGAELELLYLGRLHPIKGLEQLLRACAKLRADAPALRWRLRVAGAGEPDYERALRKLVGSLELDDLIEFLGFVDEGPRTGLLGRADLVVLPSHSENFGMVVAEALAHGTAVVASRGTPWKDLEQHGCGAWVPNDAASLAAALERLAAEDLRAMGTRGRSWMERDFSWDSVARRALDLYAGG